MKLYSIVYSQRQDKLFACSGLVSYDTNDYRRVLGVIEAVSPEMAIQRWLAEAN